MDRKFRMSFLSIACQWLVVFSLTALVQSCGSVDEEDRGTYAESRCSQTLPHESLEPGTYDLEYLLGLASYPAKPIFEIETDLRQVKVVIDDFAIKKMGEHPERFFEILDQVVYAKGIATMRRISKDKFEIWLLRK